MTLLAAFAAIALLGLVSLALTLPPHFWRTKPRAEDVDRAL